ncbi:hypothetical protein PSTG_03831 [Puccinia striiformis f. sp. tritici PST-78]|uniref:Glucose-methanol-choline oxidoreductase N-terminal domain-containing protein n=1 Tax=Puccinia striiformis f. sp. tritici PST-78 TaxID=1165861 RepID=A0A0L0VV49_9BASI|nr:hypothetical protein PSTG_03831 [Puccinia striiformis f. sp. tritici PST-78]
MLGHGSRICSLLFLVLSPRRSHTAATPDIFDYIVVGGGTAGMAVASRLSEDPALTVLVLEAGGTGANNTGIGIPGLAGSTRGTEIDWKYSTVPQSGANQRQVSYPTGKVLGGSSALNFMISTKAEKDDYNAIENLGNPGWGWSEIDRASKKSEKLIIPAADSPFPYNPIYHGFSGPVENSFPKYVPPQFKPYFPAAVSATAPNRAIETTDPFGGDLEGAYIFPSAIDAMSGRVTSATAYCGGLLSHGISVLDYQTLESIVSPEELLVGMKLLKRDPSAMSRNQFTAISDRILNGVAVEFLLLNAFFEADDPPDPNTSYLVIATTLQHPLSRGSSHINSKDPSQSPLIDPGFLSHPFDAWLMVQAAKHARKIMAQPQYKNVILNEHYPGPSVQTDAEWIESAKSRVRSEFHPIGTSCMMPQNESGVVDPQLKVYGTQNLRVVDASIIPIQISAHLAITVYAIAEKAAELIL